MSHFSSYDEDEAKESEREGKRRKMEFDCPSCNANNPTPEPIADGSELLCNYCGNEYKVKMTAEGRMKLKEM